MTLQQNYDWASARQVALNCLDATWSLLCWAEWSQEGDYDTNRAVIHLDHIGRGRHTFKKASFALQPGLFEVLAVSSVGEGPRPNFQFGPVCCATAHETAFELLRRSLLQIENWLCCMNIESVETLSGLSLYALRDALTSLGKAMQSTQSLVESPDTHVIHAWIDREWAAVSGAQGLKKKRRHRATTEKKSWKKGNLEEAVKSEIKKYNEMVTAARNGKEGALKKLRGVLGRNAIADRLGVKSAKQVGNTSAWRQLADEFDMGRKGHKAAILRPAKIGLEIAEEQAATARGDTAEADVDRGEILSKISRAIHKVRGGPQGEKIYEALVSTRDKLQSGEYDDVQAKRIVNFTLEQLQDDGSHKAMDNH